VIPAPTQQAKLSSAVGERNDQFGTSVAVDGDTIIVRAPGAGSAVGLAQMQGLAFVFIRQGTDWIPQATLFAAEGQPFDAFGTTVALQGDVAAVGARFADGKGAVCVCVFVRNGVRGASRRSSRPRASTSAPTSARASPSTMTRSSSVRRGRAPRYGVRVHPFWKRLAAH
jgi:hypothetical protein